jgi:hypothetical protein
MPLQLALEPLTDGQRGATVEILREGRTPEKLRELCFNSLGFASNAIEGACSGSPVACQRGCHWCCSIEVAVSAPELFTLARIIRERGKVDEVRDRIDRVLQDRAGGGRPFCALLNRQDGECSVYDNRPLSCAWWNSLDKARCQTWAETGRGVVPVLQLQLRVAGAVVKGLLQGLGQEGLSARTVELMEGLKRVLDDPQLESRYLRGEKVLADFPKTRADAGVVREYL